MIEGALITIGAFLFGFMSAKPPATVPPPPKQQEYVLDRSTGIRWLVVSEDPCGVFQHGAFFSKKINSKKHLKCFCDDDNTAKRIDDITLCF